MNQDAAGPSPDPIAALVTLAGRLAVNERDLLPVVTCARSAAGSDWAALLRHDPARETPRTVAATGLDRPSERQDALRLGADLVRWVEREDEPLWVPAPDEDPRFRGRSGLLHVAALPLRSGGVFLGCLVLGWSSHAVRGASGTLRFLSLVAQLAASVLRAREAADARERATADLERLTGRVETAQRRAARAELAGDTAHELVRTIETWRTLVGREVAELPGARAQRLAETLDDLLTPLPGGPQPVDVDDVLDEELDAVSGELERKTIQTYRRSAADLPPIVVDPRALRRVLGHLLSAAVHRAEEGGQFRVRTRRTGDVLVLGVVVTRSRGPAALDALLETLSTMDGTLSADAVRGLVAEMHGTLEVRARGDAALGFRLEIPLAVNQDRRRGGDRRQAA